MSVKIRLMRMGAKKKPSYRMVVADIRSPRDGKIIENLGYYDPMTDPSTIKIDEQRAINWLEEGALPSDSVLKLLTRIGVYQRFTAARDARHAEREAAKKNTSGVAPATDTPPGK